MSKEPLPPPNWNVDGSCSTGRYRIRPIWLFGFCVVEELIMYRDGKSVWKRVRSGEWVGHLDTTNPPSPIGRAA